MAERVRFELSRDRRPLPVFPPKADPPLAGKTAVTSIFRISTEGERFELSRDRRPLPVFKTGAFNHSATLPKSLAPPS